MKSAVSCEGWIPVQDPERGSLQHCTLLFFAYRYVYPERVGLRIKFSSGRVLARYLPDLVAIAPDGITTKRQLVPQTLSCSSFSVCVGTTLRDEMGLGSIKSPPLLIRFSDRIVRSTRFNHLPDIEYARSFRRDTYTI